MQRKSGGLVAVVLSIVLVACGGDDAFTNGDESLPPDVPGDGEVVGGVPAGQVAAMAFTAPVSNRITDLGEGVYQQVGSLVVTNRDGLPVADGTAIDLIMIDTVITQARTGSIKKDEMLLSMTGLGQITRRCAPVFEGAEAVDCMDDQTNTFESDVFRNGLRREIQPGDFVVISNTNAEPPDRFRRVVAVDGPSGLIIDRPYTRDYDAIQFWVGTALSGGTVLGRDASGNLIAGRTITTNGVAAIRVRYPANSRTIGLGCFGYDANGRYSSVDLRDSVPQSRQTILAATASNGRASVDVGEFCFLAAAGGEVIPSAGSVTLDSEGSTVTIRLTAIDGGDGISKPYRTLDCMVAELERVAEGGQVGNFNVGINPVRPVTDINGRAMITLTRAGNIGGGEAVIECTDTGDRSGTPARIEVSAP